MQDRSGYDAARPSARRRPFTVPDDLQQLEGPKAAGRVTLPFHIDWGDPKRIYNLDDPRDRGLLYEDVLREGRLDDLRRFIDVDELIRLWNNLVLPRYIKQAWAARLREQRGVDLTC